MALGDGDTWDETTPTNNTTAVQIDDYNRDLRVGVRSRMAHEHEWPDSQSATAQGGQHKYITLQNQATKPTLSGTQVGAIYQKTSALYYEDSGGTEVILAANGTLAGAGRILQVVSTRVTTYTTGSGQIPDDNTIPQTGEGFALMQRAITPIDATSVIVCRVVANVFHAGAIHGILTAFIDTTANAIGVSVQKLNDNFTNRMEILTYINNATTAARTVYVRLGDSGGSQTLGINGVAAGYGGTSRFNGSYDTGIYLLEVKTG